MPRKRCAIEGRRAGVHGATTVRMDLVCTDPPRRIALRAHPKTRKSEIVLAAIALAASAAFPLGILGGLAALTAIGALIAVIAVTPLWRLQTSLSVARERWSVRDDRAARLPLGSPEYVALGELTYLVDQIEHEDPDLARRLELEALLDRHVSVALAHRRAMRAVLMSDRSSLERIRDELRDKPGTDPRHLDLYERRLVSQGQCEARASTLATELSMIEQLIRLAAQRALCPDIPPADDLVERRLLELDARDAADRDLAAS